MFEKKNPTVKPGDKILLKESRNGLKHLEGVMLEVTSVQPSYCGTKQLDGKSGGTVYFGNGYAKDTYVMADRKTRARIMREHLSELQEECVALEKEIKELDRFDSEEDAVADKISMIIKTKGDTAGIAFILKEMKESNYL